MLAAMPIGLVGKVVKALIASAAVSLASTLLTAALTTYGVVNVGAARLMLVFAGLVIIGALTTSDYLCDKSWKHVLTVFLLSFVLVGSGLFLLDGWAIRKRAEQDAHTTPPPLPKTTINPPVSQKTPPRSLRPQKLSAPSTTVKGNQNVTGNTLNQGPCSVAQLGGTGNQAIGGNCQVENPYKPVVTYDFNGIKRTTSPGRLDVDETEITTFIKMQGYVNAHEWKKLADLAEETMRRIPDWPTPYFAAGEAYACLNDQTKSIQELKHFKEKADDGVSYRGPVSDADNILLNGPSQACTSKE
jgi:hypothetical protein